MEMPVAGGSLTPAQQFAQMRLAQLRRALGLSDTTQTSSDPAAEWRAESKQYGPQLAQKATASGFTNAGAFLSADKQELAQHAAPGAYISPTARVNQMDQQLAAHGDTSEQIAAAVHQAAGSYATSQLARLARLQESGALGDDFSSSYKQALSGAGADPAAQWRAVSGLLVPAAQKAGFSDPRAWLRTQSAQLGTAAPGGGSVTVGPAAAGKVPTHGPVVG